MGNLLSLPTKATQVQDLQSAIMRLGKYQDDDSEMLNSLDDMIRTVKAQENKLYQDIQCGDYNGLLERLKEIPDNGFQSLLPNGSVFQHYNKSYRFPISTNMSEAIDELEIMMNNLEGTPVFDELMETVGDQFKERALIMIKDFFKQVGATKGHFRTYGSKASGTRVGLGRLTYTKEKGKINVDYDGDIKLSSNLLQKIRQTAMVIQDSTHKGKPMVTEVFTKDSFKEHVMAKVLERLEGRDVLEYVLRTEGHNVEITRSYAGLKGFLGEIRALAILTYLFGKGNAQGTGPLKEAATKQSIAVDTLFQVGLTHYGVQVKNYTLKNNSVTFNRQLNAVDFVKDRLCVTGDLQGILLAFFGSYQFNQPFSDDFAKRFEDSWMTVPQYKELVYSKFQENFLAMQDLFDSRMGNILRIGRNFSVEDSAVFGEEKMYYNTFFFIEKELVPSSVILQAIKDAIISRQLEKTATTKYELLSTSSEPTLENNYKKAHPNGNLLAAAQKPKVSYSITLNVADLVQKAIKGI